MTRPLVSGAGSITPAQWGEAGIAWREPAVADNQVSQPATLVFQTHVQLTTGSLVGDGALYKITISIQVGGPAVAAGTDVEIQAVTDIGTPGEQIIAGPFAEFGVTTGRFAFTGVVFVPFPAGVHTVDIQHREIVSPGTYDALSSFLSLERFL